MFHNRPRRPRTPPLDELLITDMLDQLTPAKPKTCVPALENKAYYLLDQAKGIISRSARESLVLFPRDSPLFGIGIYGHVRPYVEQQDEIVYSFCLELLPTINYTPTNLITMCLAHGAAKLECESVDAAIIWLSQVRNALCRLKSVEKITELRPYYAQVSTSRDGPILYLLSFSPLQALDNPTE